VIGLTAERSQAANDTAATITAIPQPRIFELAADPPSRFAVSLKMVPARAEQTQREGPTGHR